MKVAPMLLFALSPLGAMAADCEANAPAFSPLATTFEATCPPGKTVVHVLKAKSPVVKLNFPVDQEITISTESGAKSSGHNGKGAQVCIWQSWDMSRPCGKSLISDDGFNDWNGDASCGAKVPKGVQYIRALQVNQDADEQNTTIKIECRRNG